MLGTLQVLQRSKRMAIAPVGFWQSLRQPARQILENGTPDFFAPGRAIDEGQPVELDDVGWGQLDRCCLQGFSLPVSRSGGGLHSRSGAGHGGNTS